MELPGPLARRRVLIAAAVCAAAVLVLLVAGAARRNGGTARPAPRVAYPIPGGTQALTVEVLNATRRHGLARTATRQLRMAGLDVVFFGNDDRQRDSSLVVVRRGEAARGDTVARALGIGRVTAERDTLRRVDVTVYLGTDFVPAPLFHP